MPTQNRELTKKNTRVFQRTHVFFGTHVCSFSKMCSKVCYFARLSFGLVEAENRTNGQFPQCNSSLNQTKAGRRTHFLERTHMCSKEHMCVLLNTCVFLFVNSLVSYKKRLNHALHHLSKQPYSTKHSRDPRETFCIIFPKEFSFPDCKAAATNLETWPH